MLDVSSVAKDEQLLTAANRAITYLSNEHLRFFRSYLNFYILEKHSIKLGGNALAALALAKLFSQLNQSQISLRA